MHFSLPLAVLGFVVTVCAQTDPYAGVLADLAYLQGNVTQLDTDITAFANPTPPGTLLQALAIHSDSVATGTILSKTLTDTLAVPATTLPSDADAASILSSFVNLKPIILDALSQIVTKKSDFVSQAISGLTSLVSSDISTLSKETKSLESAIVARTPASLTSSAMSLTSAIDAAFATAVAAYP